MDALTFGPLYKRISAHWAAYNTQGGMTVISCIRPDGMEKRSVDVCGGNALPHALGVLRDYVKGWDVEHVAPAQVEAALNG